VQQTYLRLVAVVGWERKQLSDMKTGIAYWSQKRSRIMLPYFDQDSQMLSPEGSMSLVLSPQTGVPGNFCTS